MADGSHNGDRPALAANAAQAERLHRFAHDLKNRLTGLHQALGFALDGSNGQEELRTFGERQFFDALRNVEDLLDDLAVARGPGQLQLVRTDLAEVVRTAVKDQSYRFEAKHQRLEQELPEHIMVNGDAHLLRDLAGALLSNASKFTPKGGAVRLSLKTVEGRAVLQVTDQGVGLNEADLGNVFRRYAMLSSRSTAGEAQGRGTLARARQWAHAHGGELEAASPGEGAGCTFTLSLPLA